MEEELVIALRSGVLPIEFAQLDNVLVRYDVVTILVLLHRRVLERAQVA